MHKKIYQKTCKGKFIEKYAQENLSKNMKMKIY